MAGEDQQPMTDYEKERLSRIRENEACLQALGIRRLAASPLLHHPSPAAAAAGKRKQKKRSDDADEEYLPSDDGGCEEEEESSSAATKMTRRRRSSLPLGLVKRERKRSYRTQENLLKVHLEKRVLPSLILWMTMQPYNRRLHSPWQDLQKIPWQAIALSLAGPSENSVAAIGAKTSTTGSKGSEGTPYKNNNTIRIQDSAKNRKIKKQVRSRIQLTQDAVVAFFLSFDEAGKGYITMWDLERMANVHDFIWTDSEISKMIHCFDSDRDGKMNLEDFRTIVSRCNMLQEPGK